MPLGAARLNGLARYIVTTPQGKNVYILGSAAIMPYGKTGNSYATLGNSGWLEIEQHNDFAFGTSQDFTIEGWFWHGGFISGKYFWDGRATAASVACLMDGTYLKVYINNAYRISGPANALRPNTWHHVAYTRQGTTGTLWWNGTSVGTWTDTTDYTHANGIKVGSRYVYGQGSRNSYVDEFRISNTARYTTAFTPSTNWSGDANTLLLLHLDDSSYQSRTPKTLTAQGNARCSIGASKFSSSSMLFDGSNSGVRVSETSGNNLNLSTGDYSVECWVYLNSTANNQIILDLRSLSDANNGTNNNGRNWILYHNATLRLYENGSDRITGSALSTNTWYHVAVVRSSGVTKMYLNGTQTGSDYTASYDLSRTINSGDYAAIGSTPYTTLPFNGYIDDLRISDTARYTTTFTPHTSPLTNDANTLLLVHGDGFYQSFYDDVNNTTFTTKVADTAGSAYSSPGAGTNPPYPTSYSVATSTNSTSSTITVPSTARPGDILMLFDMSTTVTSVYPTGWTAVRSTSTTGIINNISYKICLDSDIGATITGMAGTTRKVMLVYRGNYESMSLVLGTITAQATTATPTSQTISMSGVTPPLVGVAVYCSTGAISTRGWSGGTPTEYSSVSTSGIYVKTLIYDDGSSPSDATITMSDGGTNVLTSFYFQPY